MIDAESFTLSAPARTDLNADRIERSLSILINPSTPLHFLIFF